MPIRYVSGGKSGRQEWKDFRKNGWNDNNEGENKSGNSNSDGNKQEKKRGKFRRIPVGEKDHYTILDLTIEASAKEIKSAYYEQSKLYHPDVNDSEEAKVRFREISEAYEVLGNDINRRTYDSRVHGSYKSNPNFSQATAGVRDDPIYWRKPTPEQAERMRKKAESEPPTGKSRKYDYEWYYKMHYDSKTRKEYEEEEARKKKERDNIVELHRQANAQATLLVMTMFMMIFIVNMFDNLANQRYNSLDRTRYMDQFKKK
ncbi:unnamed protein product [Sphagnum balticum]